MGRTMKTLKKHRLRLYSKIVPEKTYIMIDDGKYASNKGIVISKTNGYKTNNGYFTVDVLLENDDIVNIGGDNIEIIKVVD